MLVLGGIIILSGLIMMLRSKSSVQLYKKQEIGNAYTPNESWSVTGFFEKGDRISVSVIPGEGWSEAPLEMPTEYVPDYHVQVMMSFHDSQGKNTTITIPYVRTEFGMAIFGTGIHISWHNGIMWEDGKEYGVVGSDGDYTIEFFGMWPMGKQPPNQIVVYREVLAIEYSYEFLFLLGIPICILGIIVSIIAYKAKPKKRARLRKSRI